MADARWGSWLRPKDSKGRESRTLFFVGATWLLMTARFSLGCFYLVGGPVFGPQPRIKQALFIAAPVATVLLLLWLLFGCAHEVIRYQSVPADLIPKKVTLYSVKSSELPRCAVGQTPCLTDETYSKLAENDRMLKQQIRELRALLGSEE